MKEKQVVYRIIDKNGGDRRLDKRSFMFRIFAFVFAATLGFLLVSNMHKVSAADLSQFKAGNIMSDAVMRNYTSMTEAEIQSFLKSKNACNKIATAGWYVNEGNVNGVKYNYRYDYNGTTYLYHVENGRHICMADESFNGESAAHIIYEIAHQYKINPQVLITLLQKEQGLVTDLWPNVNYQYRSATGFGCPDTAPCDAEYYGLRNQVESAAWLFNQVLSGGWTNFPLGWNNVRFNPDAACGSSWIYIENYATSALYRYTPYQPNAGALAAYTGTAACGAYGNRNFYIYFSDWFGSTQKVQYSFPQNYYNKNKGTTGLLTGETKCVDGNNNVVSALTNDGDYYCNQDFEKGTLFWEANIKNGVKTEQNEIFYDKAKADQYKKMTIAQRKDGIYRAWLSNSGSLGKINGTVTAFEKDKNYRILQAEKGVIFGNDKIGYTVYKQKAFNVYKEYYATLGAPVAGYQKNVETGIEWYTFKNGMIVGNDNNGWFLSMGESRNAWANAGYEYSYLGFPKGQIITDNSIGAIYQEYAGAMLVSTDGGKSFYGVNKNAFNVYKEYSKVLGVITTGHQKNVWTGIEWYTFKNGMIVGNDNNGWFLSMGESRNTWMRADFESGYLGFPKGQIITDNANGIIYQEYAGAMLVSTDGGKSFYGINKNAFKAYKNHAKTLGAITAGHQNNAETGIEWYTFKNGMIVGNDNNGWFESRGKIREVWANQGWEYGALGFPAGDIMEKDGIYSQKYAGGVISGNNQKGYSIENTQAEAVYDKYKNVLGALVKGWDKNMETGMEWYTYEHGYVVGNNSKGWYVSYGKSREVWVNQGWEYGALGFPTSNIEKNESTGIEWQYYEHGAVVGNDQKGWFESRGRIREIWASSGYEWGRYGFPTSNIYGRCQNYEHGTICE